MSELQISSKIQYQELLIDSNQTTLAESSEYSSLNWPRINFEDRSLNPAGFKVISAELPVVYDTILQGSNTFKITSTVNLLGTLVPQVSPITITPGNYTVDELVVEVLDQLNNTNPGWSLTWSDQTQKFTFSHTYDFILDFTPILTLENNLYKFLGFTKNSVNTSQSQTLTSTVAANPSGPLYLYLNSKNIGQEVKALVQNNIDNTPATQVCRIPITAQRGGVVFYNDPSPYNYFDFVQGFKFQNIDLYFTIENATGTQIVDFKGLSFSVKIALLTYREGGSNILSKPNNSRFVGA